MFKHLLVPLDGSQLAEAALPAALYLARRLGAWVTLVHVIERNAPETVHGERHLTEPEEAHSYLQEVIARAFPADLCVEQHVHVGQVSDVARSIAGHIEELGSDLIVMCTHGRGGLRSWLYGDIAQQVLALGLVPVLLIRPDRAGTAPSFACHRLLVPLDGTPEHEQGLHVAAGMARVCSAALQLIVVVPTLGTLAGEQAVTARLLPGATSEVLEMAQEGVEQYLGRQVGPLQAMGLTVATKVAEGDPASTVVRAARQMQADLIILGTHGRTGMDAFWENSVAPRISRRSPVPLLLVPLRRGQAGE